MSVSPSGVRGARRASSFLAWKRTSAAVVAAASHRRRPEGRPRHQGARLLGQRDEALNVRDVVGVSVEDGEGDGKQRKRGEDEQEPRCEPEPEPPSVPR
jgi:hypothetical protein